jgi:two-component system cell cycle response regulator DivK
MDFVMALFDFLKRFGKKKGIARSLKDFFSPSSEPVLRPGSRTTASKKIVVFEDSETWAAILKKALEQEGYTVFVYSNAVKAIEMVKLHKPTLVLMDLNMPEVSGFEATRTLKNNIINNPIPVVIFTSQNTPFDRMESMKQGARAFLSKEQPLEDIVIAINAYMNDPTLKSDITAIIYANKKRKKPL